MLRPLFSILLSTASASSFAACADAIHEPIGARKPLKLFSVPEGAGLCVTDPAKVNVTPSKDVTVNNLHQLVELIPTRAGVESTVTITHVDGQVSSFRLRAFSGAEPPEPAKANASCMFELIAMSEARVNVNLRDLSSYSTLEQDGGYRVDIQFKSGKQQVLYLPMVKGVRSIGDFNRTARRCVG